MAPISSIEQVFGSRPVVSTSSQRSAAVGFGVMGSPPTVMACASFVFMGFLAFQDGEGFDVGLEDRGVVFGVLMLRIRMPLRFCSVSSRVNRVAW